MDIASIIGLIAVFLLVFAPIALAGQLISFIDIGSMLIVIGGTFGAVMAAYPLEDFLQIGKLLSKAFFAEKLNPGLIVNRLVELGEKARREGILALEREIKGLNDEFLKKSVQLAVDGNEVEIIENVMGTEIEYIEERHKKGKAIFDSLGAFAPAFGMIGTLIGLIQMLQALDDPTNIGAGMAIALVTTFYGSLLANGVFLPIANKLEKRSKDEILMKYMVLAGVISIQSGDNPRVLRDKIETFIAPGYRKGSAI